MRSMVIVAVGCVAAVGCFLLVGQEKDLAPAASKEDGAPALTHQIEGIAGYSEGRVIGWRTSDFIQEFSLEGDGDVLVVDRQRNGIGGWGTAAYAARVPYEPYSMSNAGVDYFAIVGLDQASSDTVLERWRLTWKVAQPGAPPTKSFVRTQIYRGQLPSPPLAVGIDPDKRFLLLLCGPSNGRSLYQIPMQGNGTPSLLYNATSQPVLAQAWMMNPLQHATLGRIWLISGMTDSSRGSTLVLIDSANDGVFDSPPLVGSQQSLEDAGLFDSSLIVDSFVGE